jgi:DNA-binding MarR family transcriptional regulator
MSDGDGVTSAGRNLLRVVERYSSAGSTLVTAGDVTRGLGSSRQYVAHMATALVYAGMLSVRRAPKVVYYSLTDAGRRELEENQLAYLLVTVDDQAAEEVAAVLGRAVGVEAVEVHGQGCCCQHCPHKGNCL